MKDYRDLRIVIVGAGMALLFSLSICPALLCPVLSLLCLGSAQFAELGLVSALARYQRIEPANILMSRTYRNGRPWLRAGLG